MRPAVAVACFVAALAAAGARAVILSNGKLRVESASDSIEWLLQLMRAHRLPPAEIVAKMVEGSVQKFLKEVSLLNQVFVKAADGLYEIRVTGAANETLTATAVAGAGGATAGVAASPAVSVSS